jgi:hypothetical protein
MRDIKMVICEPQINSQKHTNFANIIKQGIEEYIAENNLDERIVVDICLTTRSVEEIMNEPEMSVYEDIFVYNEEENVYLRTKEIYGVAHYSHPMNVPMGL